MNRLIIRRVSCWFNLLRVCTYVDNKGFNRPNERSSLAQMARRAPPEVQRTS
ncbi:hypothetical protein Plhal304r1_c025g0083951 [Plasmopara halstedii]